MKTLALALVALVVAVSSAQAQTVPQIPVESVPDFFQLPIGVNFGEVPAVAVNSQGHIFVFSRSNPTGGDRRMAFTRPNSLSSARRATSSASTAGGSTAGRSRMASGSIRTTTSGR